jgi:hypothetical protein
MVSVAVFPVVLIVGLVALGLLVGLILLLAHPKTRVAGAVLAVILFVAMVGMFGLAGLFFTARSSPVAEYRVRAMHDAERHQERLRQEMQQRIEEDSRPGLTDAVQRSGVVDAADFGLDAIPDPPPLDPPDDSPPAEEPSPQPPPVESPSGEPSPGEPPPEASEVESEHEAAVEPALPVAASAKPAWVGRPAQRTDRGYEQPIVVGPYTTELECETHLGEAIEAATDDYVAAYLGAEWAGRVRLPRRTLLENAAVETWQETIQASFGPMIQWHVLLRFDDKFNGLLRDARQRTIVRQRLWYAGTGTVSLLALLSLAYGGLKADAARGGRRRGRLIFLTTVTAAAVVGGALAVLSWAAA